MVGLEGSIETCLAVWRGRFKVNCYNPVDRKIYNEIAYKDYKDY